MSRVSGMLVITAVFLSEVMFFVVGYNYAVMKCGILHYGFSAPAETAFLYAVPFLAVMGAIWVVAYCIDRRI